MASNIIINQNELGSDLIRNGLFGNSNLTAAGTFPNAPKFYEYNVSKNSQDKLVLTLQKVKDSLKEQLKQEQGTSFENDDQLIEKFLFEFTSLLVDYSDLRNYIFFGSAYTELSYNIKFLVQNYPYKFLISTPTIDLNTISSDFSWIVDSANNQTTFVIKQSAIKDGIEEFNFIDNNLDFNWLDYDLEDNNGIHYPIVKVITPYDSTSIFPITNIVSFPVTPPVGLPYNTLKITTGSNHGYLVGQSINIFENLLQNTTTLVNDQSLDDSYVISSVISPTEFLIVSKYAIDKIISNDFDLSDQAIQLPSGYTVFQNGRVRKMPLNFNDTPYTIKVIVEGNVSEPQFISYVDELSNALSGFMLSPKLSILSNFQYNLTPIQNILLSPPPINPTPWPRRIVTLNIQHLLNDSIYNSKEELFIEWLQSPSNLYLKELPTDDDEIAFSDLFTEYRLVRALSLDETETNQLLRRCIPHDIISELNDTPDFDFQRFILIAGWLFDQIYVYIKFLKYVHTLNYSDFNQLSPQYYKLYADYYGFDLFDDDNIDFSKLVISTEPGFFFIDQNTPVDPNNRYYKKTVQQLQFEREKRLLLSLFYLYRSKGTSSVIKKIVSLLGAPDGFLVFNEFTFQIDNTDQFDYYGSVSGNVLNFTGKKVVDNEKVFVPKLHFEPDPDYPVQGNMPPVFRMRLHNESDINLRMASLLTNPNGAVDSQIINLFGIQKYFYSKFNNGEFANLQPLNDNFSLNTPYYALPLTIPDKFSGVGIEYMIPKDGYKKGVGNNLDEVSIHLCSLFQLSGEVVNNKINAVHTYLLPETFSNYDYTSVRDTSSDTTPATDNQPNVQSDFNILSKYLTNTSSINIVIPYIIVRLEGNDLVVRCRLEKEITGSSSDIGERVALFPNLFSSDGLNHFLKIQFRPEGIEVYEDYSHLGINRTDKFGIARWKDPTTSPDLIPYCAFEIPKNKIFDCQEVPYDGTKFFAFPSNLGQDNPKYWDLFTGFPSNIDFYFKRVEIYEGYSIDSFNLKEKLLNNKNYTGEYYSFDFTDNEGDISKFSIRCEFSEIVPNVVPADYTYILPVEQFNQKIVIQDLKLTPKNFIRDSLGNQVENLRYYNIVQDFFNIKSDIFKENAYQKDIHKAYEYDNFFGKVNKLYNLYSPQVLTYDLLSDFLDLIENKFQGIIKNFIPIVINISEFGRLITNSIFIQDKVRYTNIEKFCDGKYVGEKAIMQERIYSAEIGLLKDVGLTINLINGDTSTLLGPINISWGGSTALTLGQVLLDFQNISINTLYPFISASLNDDLLILTIDTNWYNTNFGQDVNQVTFEATDGTTTFDKLFAYGVVGNDLTDCGFVEYRLPFMRTKNVFVFYDSEGQPPRYIYYDSEGKAKTFVNFTN